MNEPNQKEVSEWDSAGICIRECAAYLFDYGADFCTHPSSPYGLPCPGSLRYPLAPVGKPCIVGLTSNQISCLEKITEKNGEPRLVISKNHKANLSEQND